jgi:predicted metal-dependent hydrolase
MNISGIDISINRSQRKTVSIFIERDGSVSARVPENLEDNEIASIILAKEYLIHKNLAEHQQLNERFVIREYVNGQSFLYLGRNYKLRLVEEQIGELKFSKGVFLLDKSEREKAKEYFINFYKNKLKDKLPSIIKKYQNQLGVESQELKVMELQHRWASCSANGNLNFHWKCAMAPIQVLHYIVVHELVHLLHKNHTSEFWNEIDKILPNYQNEVSWLKLNGAGMDL